MFIYDGFESTENTLRNEIKGTEYIGYVPSEYIFVLRYFHIFVFKSCILFSQGMFEPFLKSFYIRSSDPTHIKLLKVKYS